MKHHLSLTFAVALMGAMSLAVSSPANAAVDSAGDPVRLHIDVDRTILPADTTERAVVMVGLLPTGPQPVLISLAITRELELKGSFRFNDEIDDVIAALADGSLQIDPVITHEYPVGEALEAFGVARNSAESGKVLLSFGAGDAP